MTVTEGERFWYNTAQAAEYAGRHRGTVEKACASGELHGEQRKKRGRWRIHKDCLEAWLLGEKCPHASPAPLRSVS